jgi:hypothetical protein
MQRRFALEDLTRRHPHSLRHYADANQGYADWIVGPRAIATRAGLREWLGEALDRLVLAMAVAGAQDDPATLDPRYAEGMVPVFDDYFSRKSAK